MSRHRSAGWAIAAAAAATTWFSFLSWRDFSAVPGGFLQPLAVLALVVAGTGALMRWWGRSAVVVLLVQVLVSVAVASWLLVGVLPVGAGLQSLRAAFDAAISSAQAFASPVPRDAPPIDPILVAGGLGCLLLVDALACTLRRVPLAGLPLLAVQTVPLGLLSEEPAWAVFALSAGGFLLVLFLHESERLGSWGRGLPGAEQPAGHAGGQSPDGEGHRVRTSAVRTSAVLVGASATALAVVVPAAVPALDLRPLGLGGGSGGSSQIDLENPMTDLRRDLRRGEDIPLLRVRTDDPRPSYLRISVLNRFSENAWTSGDRDIPGDQVADGRLPALEGVDQSVPRREHEYQVQVSDDFRSTWLPTQAPVQRIRAAGDWRYDTATMDFIASDDDLDTAGLAYSMTSIELQPDPATMLAASSGAGEVSTTFLELPRDTPDLVRDLATRVTQGTTSRFGKAVALQDWFRRDGGFTYDLEVDLGNGTDDLVAFLSEGGRTGYCEQFASAMAVMARSLGIPARVAVGFLAPDRTGPRTYEYSAWDLHAWPELFIPGAGWTRFEPTPPTRASGVPSYTQIDIGAQPGVSTPTPTPTAAPTTPGAGAGAAPRREPEPERSDASNADRDGFPVWRTVGGLLAALVLVALLLAPGTVRRGRRRRRLAGSPEDVWDELRDSAVDLGLRWPRERSPREVGEWLRARDCPDVEVERLVTAVERARYAPPGPGRAGESGEPGALHEPALACLAVLHEHRSASAQRRARWWPRSVFARRPRSGAASVTAPTVDESGEVVEHVG